MNIAEQYNNALHEYDKETIGKINKMLPDARVQRMEFSMLINMGKYSEQVLSMLKCSLATLFSSSATEIKYTPKPLKKLEVLTEIFIDERRSVKELFKNELVELLSTPYCGIVNVYFILSDGSRLWINKCHAPTDYEWREYIRMFKKEMGYGR